MIETVLSDWTLRYSHWVWTRGCLSVDKYLAFTYTREINNIMYTVMLSIEYRHVSNVSLST